MIDPDLWASAHFIIWKGEQTHDLLFTVPAGTQIFAPFDCYACRVGGQLVGGQSVDMILLSSTETDMAWPEEDDGVFRMIVIAAKKN